MSAASRWAVDELASASPQEPRSASSDYDDELRDVLGDATQETRVNGVDDDEEDVFQYTGTDSVTREAALGEMPADDGNHAHDAFDYDAQLASLVGDVHGNQDRVPTQTASFPRAQLPPHPVRALLLIHCWRSAALMRVSRSTVTRNKTMPPHPVPFQDNLIPLRFQKQRHPRHRRRQRLILQLQSLLPLAVDGIRQWRAGLPWSTLNSPVFAPASASRLPPASPHLHQSSKTRALPLTAQSSAHSPDIPLPATSRICRPHPSSHWTRKATSLIWKPCPTLQAAPRCAGILCAACPPKCSPPQQQRTTAKTVLSTASRADCSPTHI